VTVAVSPVKIVLPPAVPLLTALVVV